MADFPQRGILLLHWYGLPFSTEHKNMAYIRKDKCRKDNCEHKEQKDINCLYSFGRNACGMYLQLRTYSKNSENKGISQTLRIPKTEVLFFLSEMLKAGMLSQSDLDGMKDCKH